MSNAINFSRQVPTISFVLLTHATVNHLGAYAHCCKHIPLFHQIPVYATEPVISLGRTLTQDLYNSTPLAASFLPQTSITDAAYPISPIEPRDQTNILLPAPTPEDITGYFAKINTLRYSQVHQPIASPWSPPVDGLTITAYCAGHTLGGAIWHIQHGSESVVYAVDWNLARENALPGAAWLGGSGATGAEIIEQLRRPTALICSSKGAGIVAPAGGLKRRDELLLEQIMTTVAAGGSVLIPCDTSARALELAYTLERAWETEAKAQANGPLRSAKLYFASTTGGSTMKEARRLLEWMDGSIVSEFELISGKQQGRGGGNPGDDIGQGSLPFTFKHLKMIERKSQLHRALSADGPRVFLASDEYLEWGFSRSIFNSLATDQKNLVLLASPIPASPKGAGQYGKLVQNIGDLIRREKSDVIAKQDSISIQCQKTNVDLRQLSTVALSGKELTIYQQHLAQQRQRQTTINTDKNYSLENSADVVDEQSSSSSDSEDSDNQGRILNTSAVLAHSKHKLAELADEDLGVNILLRRKNIHDFDVRGKRGREKIFPYVAKRRRVDEFGDVIRPEEYLRAEERDDVDVVDMANNESSRDISGLGQKRKWNEAEPGRSGARRRPSFNAGKRRKLDNGNDAPGGADGNEDMADVEDSEESEYEPEETAVRGPQKVNFSTQTLQLNAKFTAIDFFGIHDRRSLNMLIPLIRPRKLILVAGTEEETQSLAEDCRKLLVSSDAGASKANATDVLTPSIGMSVDASVDTNAWTIKLTQTLYKRLRWQNFRGLGIVTLSGRLETPLPTAGDENTQKRQKLETGDTVTQDSAAKPAATSVLPVLAEIPEGMTTSRPVSDALHVGDLRLAELRRLMQASGHTAEFKGEGTLLVDGIIAVRKSGIGKIEVESGGLAVSGGLARLGAGASFYDVRRKIYEGLAVVAAR